MSLESTRPRWCASAIATNSGWVDPRTNEVLIAIGNLKARLEAEKVVAEVVVAEPVEEIVAEVVERKARVPRVPRAPKQEVIAEVVEFHAVDIVAE